MPENNLMGALRRILTDTVRAGLREMSRGERRPAARRRDGRSTRPPRGRAEASYPGDYRGMPRVAYSPLQGKTPDPGEIVWTWVPYEEDHARGKDRPVLLVGRDGRWLLGLQLTSKDHDRDAAQEARENRHWVDIGTGAWDDRGRASEVRVNRVIRIDPDAVRRVSIALPRNRFDAVVAGMRRHLR